jgi:hypothetical protein
VRLTAPESVLFTENVCIFTASAKAEKIWGVEYLILLPYFPPFRAEGPFHAWNILAPSTHFTHTEGYSALTNSIFYTAIA